MGEFLKRTVHLDERTVIGFLLGLYHENGRSVLFESCLRMLHTVFTSQELYCQGAYCAVNVTRKELGFAHTASFAFSQFPFIDRITFRNFFYFTRTPFKSTAIFIYVVNLGFSIITDIYSRCSWMNCFDNGQGLRV